MQPFRRLILMEMSFNAVNVIGRRMESRTRKQTGSDRDNKKGHIILYGAHWRVPKNPHVYHQNLDEVNEN